MNKIKNILNPLTKLEYDVIDVSIIDSSIDQKVTPKALHSLPSVIDDDEVKN